MRFVPMSMIVALVIALAPGVARAQRVIVIDAGHGGGDPGGTGTGLQEKSIVLDVTQRFKALLDADTADTKGGGSWTVKLTRGNDTAVSLAARSAYSNNQGADRFMSIHANAFADNSANGTETFSLSGTGTGAGLRNLVQQEMIAAWGLTNRGNKTANFAVLRDTAAPAELHELAFITNVGDAAKLASPAERQKAAVAHLRAIQRHYNLAPYLPGAGVPDKDTGEIHGVVIDDLGPVAGAVVRRAGGADVVTSVDGSFELTDVALGVHALTVTAELHAERVVEVTVALGLGAEVEVQLVRSRVGPEPDPDPTLDDDGGCNAGGGDPSLFVLLLAGAALLRRRIRRGVPRDVRG